MMSRRAFGRSGVSVLVASALGSLGGCGGLFPASYRFRLTMSVVDGGDTFIGSSVIEIIAAETGSLLPEGAKRDWTVRGEAVHVGLPRGRELFALLRTKAHFQDMAGLSMSTLHPEFRSSGYDVVESASDLGNGRYPGPAAVEFSDYPMLVSFRDRRNPLTVFEVNPAGTSSGLGYLFQKVSLVAEITDDPVTFEINSALEDLDIVPGHSLDRDFTPTSNPNLAQSLRYSDFVRT